MSDRSEVEAIRKIFEQAKFAPRYKDGYIYDLDLHGELQGALVDVRKKGLYELKDEVFPYLTDEFWEYRESAIRVLGGPNGLRLPEFRDLAYKIWLEDENEHVKTVALSAWAGYYDGTKDPIVLKNLYNVFRSDKHAIEIRVWALNGFMKVADAFTSPAERCELFKLDELESNELLTKAIDWNKVNKIMAQYVPGWGK